MARPKKAGLDFYYREVDEMDDYRRMLLMDKYGPTGSTVFNIITDRIYKNGYYLEMPLEYLSAQIMRVIGGKWIDNLGQIIDIIRYCGEIGLFSKELLARSVITSEDFQRNYSYVSARRKADRSKYWILPPEEEKADESDPAVPFNSAQIPVSAAQTPINAAQTPVIAAQTPIIAAQTPINAAQTPINAAQTPINEAQTSINAAIIPQSRADTEQTRINEMSAEQTQSNAEQTQTKRRSADEIFCENESEYGYAAASCRSIDDAYYAAAADPYGSDDAYYAAADSRRSTDNAYYAAGYGSGAADDYREIDSAFYAAVGRHLGQTDKEQIEELRGEGADDSLIAAVLSKVAARKGAKEIHSFRYFIPAIREKLTQWRTTSGNRQREDSHIPPGTALYGFDPDDPYAYCTTTEEYLAVLDREFGIVPQGE